MLTEVVREPMVVENPHAAGFSLLVSLMKDKGAIVITTEVIREPMMKSNPCPAHGLIKEKNNANRH